MNLHYAGIILNAAGVGLSRARMIFGRARTIPKAAGRMWFAAGKGFFNFGMVLRRAGISFVCSEWFAVKPRLVSSRGRKVVSPVRRCVARFAGGGGANVATMTSRLPTLAVQNCAAWTS